MERTENTNRVTEDIIIQSVREGTPGQFVEKALNNIKIFKSNQYQAGLTFSLFKNYYVWEKVRLVSRLSKKRLF